jgi:hypothetical protein
VKTVKPPDGTAWPLYQKRAGLMHYPIFKNGHSAISDWLKGRDLGFETYIRPDPPPGVVGFVLLRHPFDRYISAVAQMWRMGLVADVPWRVFVDGVERFNRRTSAPWTARGDRHFLAQSRVVDRMPEDRRFFQLEDIGDMIEWLSAWGLSTLVPLDRQKVTDATLVAYARGALTEGIILREYAADLELWENAR